MKPEEKNKLLQDTLVQMVEDNETISARAITRKLPLVFKSPSSITRDSAVRRSLLDNAIAEQLRIRKIADKDNNKSRKQLIDDTAKLVERLEQVKSDRDLLIISHRMMVRAVGEAGGMAAWLRFFENYKAASERIDKMNANTNRQQPNPSEITD